ncbi:MAG: hypothetical protein ACKOPQ_03455 [Novosphingobium sp.]
MMADWEQQAASPAPLRAVGVGLAVGAFALLAYAGQIAETGPGSVVPGISSLGPAAIGRLMAAQVDDKGRVPAGLDRLGRDALAAAPLAYEPFFAVATRGFLKPTDNGSAEDARLLREALRRNPRSREARYFMLRHELGSGNLGGAVDQIAVLNRLNNGVTEKLMPALGAAIQSERQVLEAVGALKAHPELLEPFVKGFAKGNKPAALRIRLVQALPRSSFTNEGLRTESVRLLIGAQAFAQARALWGSDIGGKTLVHSPDFSDRKAPPPFNWELKASSTGVAEYDPTGGVSVDYFGRAPGPLLTQLLTLTPGSYQARIQYRTLGGSPGALGVQMECAGTGNLIVNQPLSGASGTEHALLVSFTVPQGCGGQLFAVAGRAQESRDPQQAVIRKVEISAGGGS